MLTGPPPGEIVKMGAYITATHGGRPLEPYETPVVSGALEVNGGDDVPETLQFDVAPDQLPKSPSDKFAPYGQEVTRW